MHKELQSNKRSSLEVLRFFYNWAKLEDKDIAVRKEIQTKRIKKHVDFANFKNLFSHLNKEPVSPLEIAIKLQSIPLIDFAFEINCNPFSYSTTTPDQNLLEIASNLDNTKIFVHLISKIDEQHILKAH